MMTLGLPWVFAGAIAGALAITALHLLSVRRPPDLWLPTARFLPERTVRAMSRTRHPSDVLLLLLRIVALLLAGLAAAAPRWQGGSGARVVLVVRDAGVTDDSLAMRAIVTSADTGAPRAGRFIFLAADSADGAGDGIGVLFPVAWRAAGRIAQDAPTDSIDLHLLLSQAPISHDADAAAWRASWPGRVVTHHPAFPPPSRPMVVALDRVGANAGDDDVVRAAFAWHAARRSSVQAAATRLHTVGLARATRAGEPAPASETPSVRVLWPSDGVPAGWRRVSAADSSGAVVANEQAVVGAWAVTATPDSTDNGTAIAWWSDGRVAATERRTETGCDRVVAMLPTAAGDALLSASANGLFDRLLAPCVLRETVSASTLVVQDVQGAALASAKEFSDSRAEHRPVRGVTAWLIPSLYAAALLLLLLEWRVRRRSPQAAT